MEIVFWIALVLGLNWAGALVRSIINPDWYYSKAAGAGFFGNIGQFRSIKLVQIGISAAICAWSGAESGYL